MALGLVFLGLGLLFVLAPRLGAALFGVPAPEGPSLAYLPAIGLRDLAFGLYLLILARTAEARTLGLILGATILIPAGDLVIVATIHGGGSAHLLPHALSGGAMALGSAWLLRRAGRSKGGTT
jgi:hypothetical protein